ncbi:hypothetical protein BD410DRAFT_786344 [Rickenella mellea]|uniref:Ubiquitin-like domain-containing protein n=1 Tax=Rickenella mellea TaxID=50990 RepID=A0A4Y7Q999_9AGAM|nr:hypothetical protein BD410DRAFT_786344 [Rickenella mellea]
MFPVTFGSFGDIVTAAQLAAQIVKALSSSCGSSVQYQELIEELRSLAATLQMAHSAAMKCTSYPRAEDMQVVVDEITQCRSVLARFPDRIHGYQKSLGKGGTGSSWRKIGWSLFKTQDVVDMKAKIAGYKETVTLFMVSLTSCIYLRASARIENADIVFRSHSITRFEDETRRELMRIKGSLTYIREGMPKSVGWTASNGVKITDALGRDLVVPPELIPTWSDMCSLLRLRFKSCAGSRLVESGNYSMFHEGLSLPVSWGYPSRDVWDTHLKPGSEMVMAIRVNRPFNRCCVVCKSEELIRKNERQYVCGFCAASLAVSGAVVTEPEKMEEMGLEGKANDDDDIRYLRHIVIGWPQPAPPPETHSLSHVQ